jgi:predicted Zn-ribbon and HTH transcriptional regulator
MAKSKVSRSKVVELLKNENLSMRSIAKSTNICAQRVSQIYQSELKKGNQLPARVRKRKDQSILLDILQCRQCRRVFVRNTHKKQMYCSVQCVGKSQLIDLDVDLEKEIEREKNYSKVARRFGTSHKVIISTLINRYGWTREMIKRYDGRRK